MGRRVEILAEVCSISRKEQRKYSLQILKTAAFKKEERRVSQRTKEVLILWKLKGFEGFQFITLARRQFF